MEAIPITLSEITKEWVAAKLNAKNLTGIRLEPMGEGVGMMSAMAVVHLEWDDKTKGPNSIVIKLAASNETNRNVAKQFNLYLKEVSYYKELAPMTLARSPKIYSADHDEQHNFFLLMEDASEYRMGSQVTGADLQESKMCLDFLATLHASLWNKVDDIAWLPNMSKSENAKNMELGCSAGWPQLLEFFGEFVSGKINSKKNDYLNSIASLQAKLDRAPRTFIHGDFRMDNMLFGQKPEHDPLMVVDFQGPLKGNGIYDVAYFLGHSAQTEVRRENEESLIREYSETINKQGITGYNFDQAWTDYRIAILYAWTVAVVIAGTMDPANERGFAWMSKMVERNSRAIEDLKCLELL